MSVGQTPQRKVQVSAGSRDMKAAYKQIAIDAQQSAFVVFAVFDAMEIYHLTCVVVRVIGLCPLVQQGPELTRRNRT